MKTKPAYIGAKVEQDLRDELVALAALLRLPYAELVARALRAQLPLLRLAAERSALGKERAA